MLCSLRVADRFEPTWLRAVISCLGHVATCLRWLHFARLLNSSLPSFPLLLPNTCLRIRNVPPGVISAGRSFLLFVFVFSFLSPFPLVFLLFGVLRHFVLLVHLASLFPYRPPGFPSPFLLLLSSFSRLLPAVDLQSSQTQSLRATAWRGAPTSREKR